MEKLIFKGEVISSDKEPLFCQEEIEVTVNEITFKVYPLSLLKVKITADGIMIDDVAWQWQEFPITIHKVGKHSTRYREMIEENITITVGLKRDMETEMSSLRRP